ncbi:hypothetical protein BFN03_00130 [Rhodococcus sp. WMMA185]|uniref:Ig-like domain-containing protein n=1 Tax=Rhodococcus sp. WMMA185 TaxID=679318 RepID=UPI0008790EAD|nr:Ig-like domain-containing protein [Rhodococcus sp. WMMA185]AOW91612.1 hypothetical protein BFN03_00130 [Rhodococcus sp. WMMA185]
MSERNNRRALGTLGAVAAAAGFTVTAGVGVGAAAPAPVAFNDGTSTFTRTISDVSAAPGDTITSTTRIEPVGDVSETIDDFTDIYPACMTFQSVKLDGEPLDLTNTLGPDSVTVSSGNGAGDVLPLTIGPESHTFEFAYEVGEDCGRNVPLATGMRFTVLNDRGTTVQEVNLGPRITVSDASTTDLAAVPSGVQIGQSVPLTATVTGGGAGDTVEFYDDITKIGTAELDDTGAATLDWTPDTSGAHPLTAKYLGNPQTQSSQSSVQTVQVSDAETGTGSIGNIFGS